MFAEQVNLSPPQIIFLRAFIGTSQPLQHFAAGGVVIPFPYAFPEEVDALLHRVRKPRKKLRVFPKQLPAPAIVGLLPAPTPAPIPLHATTAQTRLIGRAVALDGVSQHCTVTHSCERWGDTWVTLAFQVGSHRMVVTRKLSEIGD